MAAKKKEKKKEKKLRSFKEVEENRKNAAIVTKTNLVNLKINYIHTFKENAPENIIKEKMNNIIETSFLSKITNLYEAVRIEWESMLSDVRTIKGLENISEQEFCKLLFKIYGPRDIVEIDTFKKGIDEIHDKLTMIWDLKNKEIKKSINFNVKRIKDYNNTDNKNNFIFDFTSGTNDDKINTINELNNIIKILSNSAIAMKDYLLIAKNSKSSSFIDSFYKEKAQYIIDFFKKKHYGSTNEEYLNILIDLNGKDAITSRKTEDGVEGFEIDKGLFKLFKDLKDEKTRDTMLYSSIGWIEEIRNQMEENDKSTIIDMSDTFINNLFIRRETKIIGGKMAPVDTVQTLTFITDAYGISVSNKNNNTNNNNLNITIKNQIKTEKNRKMKLNKIKLDTITSKDSEAKSLAIGLFNLLNTQQNIGEDLLKKCLFFWAACDLNIYYDFKNLNTENIPNVVISADGVKPYYQVLENVIQTQVNYISGIQIYNAFKSDATKKLTYRSKENFYKAEANKNKQGKKPIRRWGEEEEKKYLLSENTTDALLEQSLQQTIISTYLRSMYGL